MSTQTKEGDGCVLLETTRIHGRPTHLTWRRPPILLRRPNIDVDKQYTIAVLKLPEHNSLESNLLSKIIARNTQKCGIWFSRNAMNCQVVAKVNIHPIPADATWGDLSLDCAFQWQHGANCAEPCEPHAQTRSRGGHIIDVTRSWWRASSDLNDRAGQPSRSTWGGTDDMQHGSHHIEGDARSAAAKSETQSY
eukprot:1184328-Prymnesium_polylepis.2